MFMAAVDFGSDGVGSELFDVLSEQHPQLKGLIYLLKYHREFLM